LFDSSLLRSKAPLHSSAPEVELKENSVTVMADELSLVGENTVEIKAFVVGHDEV